MVFPHLQFPEPWCAAYVNLLALQSKEGRIFGP